MNEDATTARAPAPAGGTALALRTAGRARWLGRFGGLAFAFFLVKGLLWLLVPALLALLARR